MKVRTSKKTLILSLVIMVVLVLSACAPAATPAPTQDTTAIQTQSAQTVVADLTASAPLATETMPPPPGPTPDPNLPVGVIPTPAAGDPAAIANYNTTINSGPGTNYVVYSAFLGGSTAKVVGKSEDGLWWAVSVPVAPTGSGWVDAGWVTVSNADDVPVLPTPPVPPTTELIPPGPTDPQAVVIANAYVRTGPGTNFPAYGIAPAGASGRVIGKSEDSEWWVVRLNPENIGAGYGWVLAEYTQATNVENVQTIAMPPASQPVAPAAPPEGAATATAMDYVNIRTGPGTSYPVLGVASPGATGEVAGKSTDGAWWQIKIPTQYSADGLAWVSADYVVTANTESIPVVEAPAPPPVESAPPPSTSTTGCLLVSQSPADATVFSPGASFTTTWVLQNTGTDKWSAGEYDLRYLGAYNNLLLHQGSDVYDLASNVDPGMTYNFSVPMIGPFDPGAYGEAWELVIGNQVVCQFYVYINIQ